MANLNVTYADLESTASRLRSGQTDIEQRLTELKRLVDTLISEGFRTDKASGAFGTSYEQFNSGATKTIQGLEGMAQFLRSAMEQFTQQDEALSAAIRG